MSRARTLQAIAKANLEQVWINSINQKGNELQLLSNERDSLNAEISDLKKVLRENKINMPEVDSTSGFDKVSGGILGSVADNIYNIQHMIESKQLELNTLEHAFSEYEAGSAFMEGLEGDLSITGSPTDPNAYKDLMYEGTATFTPGTDTTEGAWAYTGDELQGLIESLDSETKQRLEKSPSFREGFLEGRRGSEEALTTVTQEAILTKTQVEIDQINQTMFIKDMELVKEDLDNIKEFYNSRSEEISSQLVPHIRMGGAPIPLASLALAAGDTETFKKHQAALADDDTVSLIKPIIQTIATGLLDPEKPYSAYWAALPGIFDEYMEMTAIRDRWHEEFGARTIKDPDHPGKMTEIGLGPAMIELAIEGRYSEIQPGFEADGKRFHDLYARHLQFRHAGLWSDNADLFQTARKMHELGEDIQAKEMEILLNRSSEQLDTWVEKGLGIDILTMEQIEEQEDYYKLTPEQEADLTTWDMDKAFIEYKAMMLEEGDATPITGLEDVISLARNRDKVAKDWERAQGDYELAMSDITQHRITIARGWPYQGLGPPDLSTMQERVDKRIKDYMDKGQAQKVLDLQRSWENYQIAYQEKHEMAAKYKEVFAEDDPKAFSIFGWDVFKGPKWFED